MKSLTLCPARLYLADTRGSWHLCAEGITIGVFRRWEPFPGDGGIGKRSSVTICRCNTAWTRPPVSPFPLLSLQVVPARSVAPVFLGVSKLSTVWQSH